MSPRVANHFAALMAVASIAGGCANALPTFTGASTTPKYRTDLGLGGAVRLPTGKLKTITSDERSNGYRRAAEAGGVVPLGFARYGVARDWDVGLMWAGTTGRAEFRKEKVLVNDIDRRAWVFGLAPFAGWIEDDDDSGKGVRLGLDAPIAYAIEVGGIYEAWIGPRVGIEHARGNFSIATLNAAAEEDIDVSAVGLRGGVTVGMALGFRRIHAMIELTAAWEQWFIDYNGGTLNRGGIVLIPAFAMRLRL